MLPAINGQGLKELIKASLAWLKSNQQAINALNVFPVPDGDTGTNMLLTMESAWAEVNKTPTDDVGQVAHAVAHGALMGARGNSGVILSQLWRGFARSLDDKELLTAPIWCPAMQEGVADRLQRRHQAGRRDDPHRRPRSGRSLHAKRRARATTWPLSWSAWWRAGASRLRAPRRCCRSSSRRAWWIAAGKATWSFSKACCVTCAASR